MLQTALSTYTCCLASQKKAEWCRSSENSVEIILYWKTRGQSATSNLMAVRLTTANCTALRRCFYPITSHRRFRFTCTKAHDITWTINVIVHPVGESRSYLSGLLEKGPSCDSVKGAPDGCQRFPQLVERRQAAGGASVGGGLAAHNRGRIAANTTHLV
jgi:hypothetical protein